MSYLVFCCRSLADQLSRLGKRELFFLLSITRVVSVRRGFLFLMVLRIGFVSLLLHTPGLPYNYFALVA